MIGVLSSSTLSSLTPYIVSTVLLLLLLLEQILYLLKKRHLPGPAVVPPLIGNAVSMVRDPTSFWYKQSALAKPTGVSANYLVGKFIVYIRDSELSLRVFSNVRPDAFLLVGHPFGKKLFGEHNLIYMFGDDHKSLRRQMAMNFTRKALSTYSALQQIVILDHLKIWEEISAATGAGVPFAIRPLVRELNLETSQTVFVGPYLERHARDRFRTDYNLFNVGSMSLPFDLPGSAFRNARSAISRLTESLGVCAGKSRERMAEGEEPTCLIDFWMQETVREAAAAKSTGDPLPPHSSDEEIGGFLFDFLFAAQDASTSSLLWAISLLDSHPDVLEKVRKEVSGIWNPKTDGLITNEQLVEMKYTRAVAREVVRYRAPATMVPHVAVADFQLTENYWIPKGTIVFPSVYDSSFQGFTDPYRFDPDRFSESRQEDHLFKRNFLAFGYGPHQCVGQRYALNHLVIFVAMFSSMLNFKRHRSDGCDEFVYCPTISPKDGCMVSLSRRVACYPNLLSNDVVLI